MKRRSRSGSGAVAPSNGVLEPQRPRAANRKVRYAVVGLGYIAQVAVLPAFAHAKNSELAALVSGDPLKLKKLGAKYGVARRVSYDSYRELLDSGDIDAVFIALPNSLHAAYTLLAARAGVHVLCEKPMATTARECEEMIRATEEAKVKLMVAYRLHLERSNLSAVQLLKSGALGDPRIFTSDFTMQVRDEDNIRLQAGLGGGTLYDIGIYCISASRYLFQDEPVEVTAFTAGRRARRFAEVEEMASCILRYPGDRLAAFTCSFGAADVSSYRVIGTKGDLCVESGYEYTEEIVHTITVGGKQRERRFPKRDQFGPELVHFSDCILKDREPLPSGTHGLNDVRIIEALYRSAETDKPVRVLLDEPAKRPSLDAEIRRPPIRKPKLVRANSPSDGD